MIDFCLENKDPLTISNTVSQISISLLPKVLENLYKRINSYPQKVTLYLNWLQELIKQHNSLMISSPNICFILNQIQSVTQNRISNYSQIRALRLHIQNLKKNALTKEQIQVDDVENQYTKPLFVYNEGIFFLVTLRPC